MATFAGWKIKTSFKDSQTHCWRFTRDGQSFTVRREYKPEYRSAHNDIVYVPDHLYVDVGSCTYYAADWPRVIAILNAAYGQ